MYCLTKVLPFWPIGATAHSNQSFSFCMDSCQGEKTGQKGEQHLKVVYTKLARQNSFVIFLHQFFSSPQQLWQNGWCQFVDLLELRTNQFSHSTPPLTLKWIWIAIGVVLPRTGWHNQHLKLCHLWPAWVPAFRSCLLAPTQFHWC